MDATWPVGMPKSLDYPEIPVPAILAGSARRFGDRIAFRQGNDELSFAELWHRACRFANALITQGIGRGAPVAVRMPNCLAFPVAYYGLLLAGATFVPVNPLLPERQVTAQLDDAGAMLTIRADDVPAMCAAGSDTVPKVNIDVNNDLAHLAYTGGTTGVSKGVRLTHRNVVVNTIQHGCWHYGALPTVDNEGGLVLNQIGSEDEWRTRLGAGIAINLTPWFHAMGTIAGLNQPVLTGATVILHGRLDPVAYLADAERFRVTYLGGAPTLWASLLRCPDIHTRDLSSVRSVGSGAAPLSVEAIGTIHRLMPGVVLCEGYGLTEVTMGATNSPANVSGLRKAGSVGVGVFDTKIKIVPADGGEDPLPPGERGEVCIRGPQVMRGYHNRPEATADVLKDGWLHTGDIGLIDSDGYLAIVDRKKDMLIYKGYNVYPRELEELLVAQPSVAGAAVVGRPDSQVGELPVAFVVRAPGQRCIAEDLMTAINDQVVPYKRLREIQFVDQLPVSAAGKILKRALRDQLG